MSYNFDRSLEEREKRYAELSKKRVLECEATYCVITTRDGYDGHFRDDSNNDRFYFSNKRTAVAFAQHYSDICDHVAGVFQMPKFIGGISCC